MRGSRSEFQNKDVRQEAEALSCVGWGFDHFDSSGHPVLSHDAYGEVTLPSTPKGPRWRVKHRDKIAKQMGINKWQLERLMAGQPLSQARREKSPGRVPDWKVVVQIAADLDLGCDRVAAEKLLRRYGGVSGARAALRRMERGLTPDVRRRSLDEKIADLSEQKVAAQRSGDVVSHQRLSRQLENLFFQKRTGRQAA